MPSAASAPNPIVELIDANRRCAGESLIPLSERVPSRSSTSAHAAPRGAGRPPGSTRVYFRCLITAAAAAAAAAEAARRAGDFSAKRAPAGLKISARRNRVTPARNEPAADAAATSRMLLLLLLVADPVASNRPKYQLRAVL